MEKENRIIHAAGVVCVGLLATVLGLVAWDYVATHGLWVLWVIALCFALIVLAWRHPWFALGVWLGLRR